MMSQKISLGKHPFFYPLPVLLIGSYDENGNPNVMTASWAGICASTPLCISVSIQPPRKTHDSILARNAFTISIPSEDLMVQTDFAGLVSGADHDKFAEAGLTPIRSELVDAPYVGECKLAIECQLRQSLALGSHTMMIGEVLDTKADADCLDQKGKVPDLTKIAPFALDAGNAQYYGMGKTLGRSYHVGRTLIK